MSGGVSLHEDMDDAAGMMDDAMDMAEKLKKKSSGEVGDRAARNLPHDGMTEAGKDCLFSKSKLHNSCSLSVVMQLCANYLLYNEKRLLLFRTNSDFDSCTLCQSLHVFHAQLA